MSIVSASYTICDLSDGVATHFLNTTYSGTQATLENWGSTGGANWAFTHITSDYSEVKVGDSCWMRCTNTTKNGYTYVGMVVGSITSSTLVASSGLGIIDKGDTGDDAISYWLEKSATIISKDTNNSNVLTPSSVTVTAKKNVGGTTSDFTTGTIKLYADGTEISPASSTSSSITFSPSASVSTHVIKLFSGSIELDAESIPIIATGKNGTNGVNAVVAVLTNDSAQVPTDSSGNNPDFTTATTTIEVYEGGNKVTPTSYGPHVCSNCTVNATNAASVTLTGISANSATVTLKATYGGKTYSKAFTVSKQKQGIQGNPGVNATSYWVEKSATIISKDVNNSNRLTPSSVTLTAYKNVGGTTSRFTTGIIKLYADGTEVTPSATETRTFTPSASVSQYVAKLYDGNVEVDVESIPIVATGLNGQPGSPGADAMFAALTNDSAQVPADESGNVPSGTTYPSTTIELYKGATKQTSGVTYPAATYTGCTISQSGSTVTLTGMTADYATVTLKATYGGVTYSKQFTATKQKQGIHGNDGDSPTAYPQYALVYAGTTPGTNDWEDERPSNWAVGYSYWTRTKYVYSPIRTEYSEAIEDTTYNQYMQSQTYLRIITDKSAYSKDLRSIEQFTMNLNVLTSGYENPTFSWNINDETFSGPMITYSKAQSDLPDVIRVVCSLSSTVNGTIYATTASMDVNIFDITVYDLNYGVSEELLVDGPPYVVGDSYTFNDKTGGIDNYIPYVYTANGWIEITDISQYPNQMAQIRESILAAGDNVPSSSVAIYAYFKNASIQHAQIDTLNTSQITLTGTGMIQSSNYEEDVNHNPIAGFKITSAGDAAFVGSHVINSTVSGSFTSKPLETQAEGQGGPVDGALESTAYYSDAEVYSSLDASITADELVSVTGSVGNTSVTKALKITSSTTQTQARYLLDQRNISGSNTWSTTVPVKSQVTIAGSRFIRSFKTLGYSGTRTSVFQHKIGDGNWTNGSTIATVNMDTSIQVRHQIDESDVSYGTSNGFNIVSNTLLSSDFQPVKGASFWDFMISLGDGVLITKGKNNGVCTSTDNGVTWTTYYPAGQSSTNSGYGFLFVLPVKKYGSSFPNIGLIELFNSSISAYDIYSTYDGISFHKTYSGDSHYHSQITSNTEDIDFSHIFDLEVRAVGDVTNDGAPSGTLRAKLSDIMAQRWSFVSGSEKDQIVYANGVWLSKNSNDAASLRYSVANNIFFKVLRENDQSHVIYSSTDGSTWTSRQSFKSTMPNIGHAVIYCRGTYYITMHDDNQDANNRYGIFATNDLNGAWHNIYPVTAQQYVASYIFSAQGLIYVSGRLISVIGETLADTSKILYNNYGIAKYSETSVTSSGSASVIYSYSLYPVGLNLIHDSSTSFSFLNSSSSWKTLRTVMTSPSYSGIPYYQFNQFTQNSTALNEFDFRKYVSGSSFAVKFKTFAGRELNLTSSASGGYDYNLKWSGTTFMVFLNGAQTGFFSTDDFFRNDSTYPFLIAFTPLSQLDAILVKDILPKDDSVYNIGEEGREFLSAHINDIYGNLHGDVTGDVNGSVFGDVTGNVSGNSGSSDRINSPDTRSTNPAPNTISKGLTLDFKSNSTIGISGHGTYSGVLTFRPYGSSTDFSGGPVHRIAFCEDGAIMHQTGNASGWGSWSYPSTWN